MSSGLSKKVLAIISDTTLLQYKMELGLTGNKNGHSSNRSVTQRLEALRREQRVWEKPKPTLVETLKVPSRGWCEAKRQKHVSFGRHLRDGRRLEMF
ncbi:hypothetical protein BC835DRAFT_1054328 [Cytidiella melzeri]|nr:hypothetical protein BC835DRAFT_1054328 [Cytidiella melzeri]